MDYNPKDIIEYYLNILTMMVQEYMMIIIILKLLDNGYKKYKIN